jgi:integrase
MYSHGSGRIGRPRKSPGPVGIAIRHSRACTSRTGGRCNCQPTYQAWVYSPRDKRKIVKTFPTLAAAKGWRIDALKAVKDKKLRVPSPKTLREEAEEFLTGAHEGRILNRRKQTYKPSVLRIYEASLRLRILPALGDRRLADISHADLLELEERLRGDGCSDSMIRNAFGPVQALYRRAARLGRVPVNPALDLELPTPEARKRAATPAQAAAQLDALGNLAPLWAAAFYSGLRRGELQALRVRNVDLNANLISVERSWDPVAGEILPKSAAGTRQVFLCDTLRPYLEPLVASRCQRCGSTIDSFGFCRCEQGPTAGQDGDEFVFGHAVPFETRKVDRSAKRAYETAGLEHRFSLHEARHSFSTFMDHAGISETRADRYMGHAAAGVAGRYRHLLSGQIAEDAKRVDEYLASAAGGKVMDFPLAKEA